MTERDRRSLRHRVVVREANRFVSVRTPSVAARGAVVTTASRTARRVRAVAGGGDQASCRGLSCELALQVGVLRGPDSGLSPNAHVLVQLRDPVLA